jgi:hypothetical protein
LNLRTRHNRNLDDSEKHNEHERQDKGEFDHSRSSLSSHARFATEMTFCITVLKKDGSMSVVDAQEMSARATTAAATITRAYSAVAWPDCERETIWSRRFLNIWFSLLRDIRPRRWEADQSSHAKP